MIPKAFITHWRSAAPWISDLHVEQDLIICRALIELYSSKLISETFVFRGGTALYKLYSTPSPRYSEDIDLVQIQAAPIGVVLSEIRMIRMPGTYLLYSTAHRSLKELYIYNLILL